MTVGFSSSLEGSERKKTSSTEILAAVPQVLLVQKASTNANFLSAEDRKLQAL